MKNRGLFCRMTCVRWLVVKAVACSCLIIGALFIYLERHLPLALDATLQDDMDIVHYNIGKNGERFDALHGAQLAHDHPDVAHELFAALFPSATETRDRIHEQLHLPVPSKQNKTILLWSNLFLYFHPDGNSLFVDAHCPVSNCYITHDKRKVNSSDAILFDSLVFEERFDELRNADRRGTVTMLYMLESPPHTPDLKELAGLVNWTLTYRADSVIVTPYGYYAPIPQSPNLPPSRTDYADHEAPNLPPGRTDYADHESPNLPPGRTDYADHESPNLPPGRTNYARRKTKMAAWFVSHCSTRNGREAYVRELQKYVRVDVYGECGPLSCPRKENEKCLGMLDDDYRFYLAFENSNCKDYITEKFFSIGLGRDVLPVVMGARPEDYARVAPPHSYIHVDDFASPRHLADYLHRLAADDDLYNAYFSWKAAYRSVETSMWCRVCGMLHAAGTGAGAGAGAGDDEADAGTGAGLGSGVGPVWYRDVNEWWRGGDTCQAPIAPTPWATWRRNTSRPHAPDTPAHDGL